MQFPGVVGQEALMQQLIQLTEQNRLGHALLFTGRAGSGVLPVALGFAQYVVSMGARSEPAPPALDLFGAPEPAAAEATAGFRWDPQALIYQHPDLHFSYPVVKKEGKEKALSADFAMEWRQFLKETPYASLAEWIQFSTTGADSNKQGNISAAEVEDILRKLSLKSFKGRYKVLLMWMPEFLGTEGNKLLKLIEEPPPDTLFILASENEQQVLPTIVSRCQLIRVPPLLAADIARGLAEKTGQPEESFASIAAMSHGSFTEALYLLDHSDHDWNSTLREWMNAAVVRNARAHETFGMQLKIVQQISGLTREKQKQLLRYFLEILEIALRLRVMPEESLALPPDELDFAKRLNQNAGPSQQKALVDMLEPAIYFIERNANPKLLFHALTIKMRSILVHKEAITME